MPNLLTTIATKLNSYCTGKNIFRRETIYANKKDHINLFFEILIEDSGAISLEEILINYKEDLISNYPERYFERPSMQTFYNKIFVPKLPALLTGLINN